VLTGGSENLLVPRAGTFFSVDVLNPDVVVFRGHYFLYFSGNASPKPLGAWQTGLAVASSPTGPFHVVAGFRGNYLNGGTTVWDGRLWHLVEDNPAYRGELASSDNGITWRHESFLPRFAEAGVTYSGADFFVEPEGRRLGVYMLAVSRSGKIGRSLAFVSYADGHWSGFHIILSIKAVAHLPWARADLGEPAAYHGTGTHYLLFVGLKRIGLIRSIGLAKQTITGWRVCGDTPALSNKSTWGAASAVDPSPLVVGQRLYLYYGATKRNGLNADLGGAIVVRVFRLP
jgi:hypothetical protein